MRGGKGQPGVLRTLHLTSDSAVTTFRMDTLGLRDAFSLQSLLHAKQALSLSHTPNLQPL